jgi:hypothetical protein
MIEPEEPKSDYQEWLMRKVIPELTELRDTLRQLQVKNTIRSLDRIDKSVIALNCTEANEVINYIMRK